MEGRSRSRSPAAPSGERGPSGEAEQEQDRQPEGSLAAPPRERGPFSEAEEEQDRQRQEEVWTPLQSPPSPTPPRPSTPTPPTNLPVLQLTQLRCKTCVEASPGDNTPPGVCFRCPQCGQYFCWAHGKQHYH